MRKFGIIIFISILFIGCKKHKPASEIKTLFENYYEESLGLFPFSATVSGDNRYNDQFPIDISDAYRDKVRAFYQKYADGLKEYDRSTLDANDQMSYDILKWDCDIALEMMQFPDHLMPINQMSGKHLDFPLLGSGSGSQPFKTEKDYQNWLSRMNVFPVWCDTAIAKMREGIKTGWILPKSLAIKIAPQLKDIIVEDPTKSIFYGPITNMPKTFSDSSKKQFTAAYTKAIQEQIIPFYKKLYDFMEKEYIPQAKEVTGISHVPDGKKYYALMAKYYTTTTMTPDEIFALGEKEVARIRKEMEAIKTQVGFAGDLKAFFKYVNDAPQLHPYKKDEEVIQGFHKIYERMQPFLKEQYDLVPKSTFEIRQTESFREKSASAEYYQGTPDGSRPGIFYCPVLDPRDYNVFQDEALFLHEAIPGHHYQISLQQENTALPKFRRYLWYGAYGEGYALYTESLGKELGLYTDPYQYFGKLGMEMHRAIRLVVDVGMHYKGWTREQAIQYSLDNEADSEANITAEIERYMAWPGQALGYKIGQLKILELKEKAKTTMGDKYEVKEFHNELLKYGCLPIAVLEAKMDEWMEKK
ncbi:MAG: DUF885 domain-containing protein [Chitinophagales bacterium]|nr:DUF885 domain-containing protein [Chitinophagales bacterium]